MIEGIDVSKYQQTVDWNAVHGAGIIFAFAKATEGTSKVDPNFAHNWSGMAAAGLIRGAYHFFRPTQDAAQQAKNFLDTVTPAAGDLPAVLDIELDDGASSSTIISGITTWLDAVRQATGRTPIIYTAAGFWNSKMNDAFGDYPLWVANYTSAAQPKIPNGWSVWTFWQYSQSGSVAGVHGDVDRNRFNGDLAALQAFVGAAGGASTPAPVTPSAGSSDAAAGTSATRTYTVQSGDTLGAIAAQFGVGVSALATLNGISDPNKIHVGQVLQIP